MENTNGKMNIEIRSVNMGYADGKVESVKVHFKAMDAERSIDITGFVPLNVEEYESHESISMLEGMVRGKLVEKLQIEE